MVVSESLGLLATVVLLFDCTLACSSCPYMFFFLVISTIFLNVAVLAFLEPFEKPLKLSSWLALLLLESL